MKNFKEALISCISAGLMMAMVAGYVYVALH